MFRKKKKNTRDIREIKSESPFEKMEKCMSLGENEVLYILMKGQLFDIWKTSYTFYFVSTYKNSLYMFCITTQQEDEETCGFRGKVVIENTYFGEFKEYKLIDPAIEKICDMYGYSGFPLGHYGDRFYNEDAVNKMRIHDCFSKKEINNIGDGIFICNFTSNINFIDVVRSYNGKENNLLVFSHEEKLYCIQFSNNYNIATYNGVVKMTEIKKYCMNSGDKLKCYYADVDSGDENSLTNIKYNGFNEILELASFIKENENKCDRL